MIRNIINWQVRIFLFTKIFFICGRFIYIDITMSENWEYTKLSYHIDISLLAYGELKIVAVGDFENFNIKFMCVPQVLETSSF